MRLTSARQKQFDQFSSEYSISRKDGNSHFQINTMKLTRQGSAGLACTSCVTEFRARRPSDSSPYTVEIERMGTNDIENLLQESLIDYRRYHLLDKNRSDIDNAEIEVLRNKANVAWGLLGAAFVDVEDCTEEFLRREGEQRTEILRELIRGWTERIAWPANLRNGRAAVYRFENDDEWAKCQDAFNKNIWLFVKVIR